MRVAGRHWAMNDGVKRRRVHLGTRFMNGGGRFRAGCTLVIGMETAEVRYMIRKKVVSPYRFAKQVQFGIDNSESLHDNYFDDEGATREPFALMHHVHG